MLISTAELAEALGPDGTAPADYRIFDCSVFLRPSDAGPFEVTSGRGAFDEGHIPGSGFLDQIGELSNQDSDLRFMALSPDELAAAFGRRGVGPDTTVVLYDRSFNMWATRVWWLLRSIGCDNALVVDGGWKAWTSDGSAVSTDPDPSYPEVTLEAHPRPETIVGTAEVQAATTDDSVCLVNALSPQIHDGSDASYGRPGRIPSSRNVFAVLLVDQETHRYRPLDELRQMFDEAGVGGDRIVTWCGGGIAATSDAFTLLRLGHENLGVYDGSLSEWVAADLPLEV
jgi:thiosulfate/3-mercaptopyruvate sulfurtransferase